MIRLITVDCYDRRGPGASWLGSARLAGCAQCETAPLGALAEATTRDAYDTAVRGLLEHVRGEYFDHAQYPDEGWLWAWCTSHATDLVYAFDEGHTWISEQGRGWRATRPDPRAPSPLSGATRPVHPVMLAYCPITGLPATDTLSRVHGRLFTDTAHLDLPRLAVRVLAQLTTPDLDPYRHLRRDLRYAITTDEEIAVMTIEVFGLDTTDRLDALAAFQVIGVLAQLPADYGWSDPDGGPPRFEITVSVLDTQQQHRLAERRDTTRRLDTTLHDGAPNDEERQP